MELLFLKDQVFSFCHKPVSITKKNGDVVKGKITNIEGASNSPHLPIGFILDGNLTVSFGSIQKMEIIINIDNNTKG